MSKIRKRMYYIVAALIVLLPCIGFAVLSALATRPTNLGVVDGKLADCPDTPNCVSSQSREERHKIEPIAFDGAADDALKRLKQVLIGMPRVKIITEKADYIHAEATSFLFRFVDDVEFYIDSRAKVIHCRSASRVGRSDLGVNRARMEQIRADFNK